MILMTALYFVSGHSSQSTDVSSYLQLIVGHHNPWETFKPIAQMEVMPFRDAGNGVMDYGISVQDCLYGIQKAIDHQLLDLTDFEPRVYTFYERVE